MKSLRITGVYDSNIVHQLKKQDVTDIGFDIRPRSFNFIQLAGIEKILKELATSKLNFYLRFDNDKEFVVKEIVDKVSRFGPIPGENLWVEYWGDEDLEYCKRIGLPFFKLLKDRSYTDWLNAELMTGLVLDETYINTLGVQSDVYVFLSELFNNAGSAKKIDLSLDWGSEISRSLLEFYPFNNLCFHLNSQVETSYRNVNLQLIKQHIEHTQRLLSEI